MPRITGVFLALLIIASLALSLACQPPPPPPPPPPVTNDCAPFSNLATDTDRPGQDYDHYQTADAYACYQACCNDPNCKAMAYVHGNHMCWFKNAIPGQVAQPGVSSMAVRPEWTFIPINPAALCQAYDPHFNTWVIGGNEYASSPVPSAQDCYTACCGDSTCTGYTFHIPQNMCYLFKGNLSYYLNPGQTSHFTSGIVRQP